MNYVLTDAAESDMRVIVRYTRKQWGSAQVRTYVAKLKAGIVDVAAGQGAFRRMDALYPGLLMAHCEHHYVFCLPRKGEKTLIVAILHESMDLMTRVAERLQ